LLNTTILNAVDQLISSSGWTSGNKARFTNVFQKIIRAQFL